MAHGDALFPSPLPEQVNTSKKGVLSSSEGMPL